MSPQLRLPGAQFPVDIGWDARAIFPDHKMIRLTAGRPPTAGGAGSMPIGGRPPSTATGSLCTEPSIYYSPSVPYKLC